MISTGFTGRSGHQPGTAPGQEGHRRRPSDPEHRPV